MSTVEQATQATGGMSNKRKITLGIAAVYLVGLVGFAVGFGIHGHKNESFKVIDSFHLESWFKIAGPLQFDKGVLYLLIATILTLGIMLYVARHMQKRPGRLQVAVEAGYDLMSSVTRENMSETAGQEMVPGHLYPVRLHPRLEPDRLHPAAGRLRERRSSCSARTSRPSRSMPR